MATLNKIMLIGNVTRDPETRYTPQGTAVTTLGLAVNRNYKTTTGEKKQEVCFVNVIAWKQLAEICGKYLQRGKPVFVEGRIQQRAWQGKDGKNHSVIEVVAENIQFLSQKEESETPEQSPEQPADEESIADLLF